MAPTPPVDGHGVQLKFEPRLLELSRVRLVRTVADAEQFDFWMARFAAGTLKASVWATRHPCDRELVGCHKLYLGRPETIGDPNRAHWGAILEPARDGVSQRVLAFGRRHPTDRGRPLHPDVYDVATDIRRVLKSMRRTP